MIHTNTIEGSFKWAKQLFKSKYHKKKNLKGYGIIECRLAFRSFQRQTFFLDVNPVLALMTLISNI
jgi:hypothetical protein